MVSGYGNTFLASIAHSRNKSVLFGMIPRANAIEENIHIIARISYPRFKTDTRARFSGLTRGYWAVLKTISTSPFFRVLVLPAIFDDSHFEGILVTHYLLFGTFSSGCANGDIDTE